MKELPRAAAKLSRNLKAEIVVVGAGISGLTTAYLLARAGKDVVVIDSGRPGGGMTSRTTGHLVTAPDGWWSKLIARRGLKKARLAAESHLAATDFIEETQAQEGIACDFARLDGFLVLGEGDPQEILERELKAAHKVGLSDVAWSNAGPFPGLKSGRCLRFPQQGRFHAIKYLNGLVEAFRRNGGRMYRARADSVKGGKKAVVKAGNWRIEADSAIVATNSPINGKAVHGKQVPYRSYVVAGLAPRGTIPDTLAWDTNEPYHYTRLQPAGGRHDLLIVGGEDHRTGEADDMEARLKKLETWARKRFPALQDITYRWSGQVLQTFDDLALIGRNPGDDENIYIATGDSGMGLTHGTLAGMIIADQILGKPNVWAPIYRPARGKPAKPDPQAKKSANKAVKAKPLPKAPKCTHAGCPLAWNSFEGCWDCSCHGSHFAADGTVTNAPAVKDLAHIANRKAPS